MEHAKEVVKPAEVSAREISISRLLNAPVELVWKVWTEPDHIKNWWGPNGFTNTIHKMEVRPNGAWDLVMHGPDGTDYKNESQFKEIIKHKKISYEHNSFPKFISTIEFESRGNTTFINWRMRFEKEEDLIEVVKKFKADEGLQQNVIKLEAYLEKEMPAKETPFTIERTYDAHVSKIWKAITDKDEMKKWYFDIAAFKPEVGFEFTFNGSSDGVTYVHLCKIIEVIPEKKLSYSWCYRDYEGNSTVTFELFAEDEKTKLKLTHEGLETFPKDKKDFGKESFSAGWTFIIGKSLKEYAEGKTA